VRLWTAVAVCQNFPGYTLETAAQGSALRKLWALELLQTARKLQGQGQGS
jgi:hypothetical protein